MSLMHSTTRPTVAGVGRRFKQWAWIGAGSLGLTGGRAPVGPLHAQVGVSDPCNHRCVMCWDHPAEDHKSASSENRFGHIAPGMMSLERFRDVVDDLHRLGTPRLDIVGRGEPMLNKALEDMVAYAKELRFLVTLCTNASQLGPERSERLVAAGLDRVNVSLNAGTPDTYPLIHVSETADDYRNVKKNLRALANAKEAAGVRAPWVKLSFVISSRNYFEIDAMVRVAHEVRAQESSFVHTTVHEGTLDLALSPAQYEAMKASLPHARAVARELGVTTNLDTFAAIVPTYMEASIKGPAVVPCYVGWYFTVVLGNGSVLPCCQCSKPIDKVSGERRFGDIWASKEYEEFRTAARHLPQPAPSLSSCECGSCMLRPRNITIHNMLHPWNRIDGGEEEQLFTVADLLRLKKVDRRSRSDDQSDATRDGTPA
jgi:MoaA/NifB/PqqE/SkfB family radical SAM enzyme